MTEEITKPFSVPMPETPMPDLGYETQKAETGGESAFLRSARHSIWPAATGLIGAYSQSPTPERRLGELEATLRSAIIALTQSSGYSGSETAKKILEAAVAPKP